MNTFDPTIPLWKADCRHFVGGLPCVHWRPCPGCPNYDPITSRVLIIMLGLLGDMLIASPLPARIKRDDPSAHITWLVDAACAPILSMNPYIDRVLPFDWRSAAHLPVETFDAIFSFERSPAAAALTDRIHASKKAGLSYGGSENSLYAVGDAARHFFLMNTWNDFRTQRNTKSWTELYFEVAGYTYEGEPYILQIPPAVDRKVRMLLGEKSSSGRVCLNVGGSLSTKIWPRDHWLALGAALLAAGHDLVITGGPTDQMVCDYLVRALSAHDSSGHRIRCHRTSIEEFAAVPAYCDVVVTGDSLGFHLALAHRRPCVLLLGPSSGSEVIPKHVTNVVALRSSLPCSPCAHQVSCGGIGGCMDTISSNQVLREVENFLTIR